MKGISSWLSAHFQCYMHCDLVEKNIQVQYYYSDFAAPLTVTWTVCWDKNEKLCGVCLKTYEVKGKREAFKETRKGLKDPT